MLLQLCLKTKLIPFFILLIWNFTSFMVIMEIRLYFIELDVFIIKKKTLIVNFIFLFRSNRYLNKILIAFLLSYLKICSCLVLEFFIVTFE